MKMLVRGGFWLVGFFFSCPTDAEWEGDEMRVRALHLVLQSCPGKPCGRDRE